MIYNFRLAHSGLLNPTNAALHRDEVIRIESIKNIEDSTLNLPNYDSKSNRSNDMTFTQAAVKASTNSSRASSEE